LARAAQFSRFKTIDASQPLDQVQQQVVLSMNEFIRRALG